MTRQQWFFAFLITCLAVLAATGCGKLNIKGLEVCKLMGQGVGALCLSGAGAPAYKTYDEITGWTCTNAAGTSAMLKQAGMNERQAVKALGLKTE